MVMNLPTSMEKFSSTARLLLLENENLSRVHLKNISASVKAGTFTAKGEHVSIEEFGALLDFLHPKTSFPVAPFDLRPSPSKYLVQYEPITTPAFSWRWWDLPIPWVGEGNTEHDLFPLPIAKLQEGDDINGCRCLLSATALWHLLPIKDPVAKFFAQAIRTKARWEWWRLMLDIGEQDVIAPPKSSAAKARAKACGAVGGHFVGSGRPSDDLQPPAASGDQDEDMSDEDVPDAPGGLKFAQWMVTPRMLLGALMWICHVQRTADVLQDAAFAILKNIVATMLPEVALDIGRMKMAVWQHRRSRHGWMQMDCWRSGLRLLLIFLIHLSMEESFMDRGCCGSCLGIGRSSRQWRACVDPS